MASLGTWPTTIEPVSFRLVMQTNQVVNADPFGGSEQVLDRLNDRWMVYMTLQQAHQDDAAEIEALVANFRGQVNTIDLWHFVRSTPRGTISGSPTVSGAHTAGAATLAIQTSAGATVKKGDLVGVGGLLLMSSGDATADGTGLLSMPLVNRLRTALSNGAAITLTKPTATFRLLSTSGLGYSGGLSEEVTMTLGEVI
ncbi:MAG TPA: hypothetical protein VGD76_01015 [Ramlibacter sp.]